jgi:hypothetical protein
VAGVVEGEMSIRFLGKFDQAVLIITHAPPFHPGIHNTVLPGERSVRTANPFTRPGYSFWVYPEKKNRKNQYLLKYLMWIVYL